MLSLIRTASVLESQGNRLFRQFGLSGASYNILRVLERAGREGRCSSDIAPRLITTVPDTTRLLDRLEKLGLVTRQRTAEDRRMVKTAITAKGIELIAQLDAPLMALHREQLGHMKKSELGDLIVLLSKARQGSDAE